MRVLIAGATGTVGQHVVAQALDRGHEVTAIARRPESLRTEHPRLRTFAADVLDPDAVVLAGRRRRGSQHGRDRHLEAT